MSCIRFNTPAQRAQMRAAAPVMAVTVHPAPAMTDSKLARLRLLAQDKNPKIRERVALDYHAPQDVLRMLALDDDAGVRACVARNERTDCGILRKLSDDSSEMVRGFLALNYYVPDDVMEKLSADSSEVIQGLVSWKTALR